MDKNMINIDDLFKQRLSDGEEKERAGAWMNMRDLLDQQMTPKPVPGATFNWRRMLGVLAGVAAISVAGLGGYQMATSFRNGGASGGGSAPVAVNTPGSLGSGAVSANAGVTSNQSLNTGASQLNEHAATSGTTTGSSDAEGNSATHNNKTDAGKAVTGTTHATGTGKAVTATTATGMAATTTKANATGRDNAQAIPANAQGSKQPGSQQMGSISGNTLSQSAPSLVASDTKMPSGVPATGGQDITAHTADAQALQQADRMSTTAAATLSSEVTPLQPAKLAQQPAATTRTVATGDNNTPAPGTATDNVYASAATATAKKPATSVGKAPVTANGNKAASNTAKSSGGLALNTTGTAKKSNNTAAHAGNNTAGRKPSDNKAAGTTPVAKKTAGQPKGTDNNGEVAVKKDYISKIEIRETYAKDGKIRIDTISMGTIEIDRFIPSAAAPASDNSVVAANAKANNKEEELVPLANYKVSGHKRAPWEPRRFEEMVQNAKMGMSSIRFHPGFLVGGNTLLGGHNTMAGFQLGASGSLNFNERWGLFAELKYVHRFNSGSTLNESFETQDEPAKIINGVNHYTLTPKTNKFSFASISGLELPIAVRYTLQRVHVFMGANYSYYFAINAAASEEKGNPYMTTTAPQPSSERVNLSVDDFGSRFGVGYMLGAGYHITPSIHLDMRMTQPVWDNMNTKATRYVSDKLFKVPTIQVNFNYRFSSEPKVR